jgi:glutamate/tyrosine decarboxylase-like PLP-dependent enzyme
LLGTRPGGPIAAAWAALQTLGEDGYIELARRAIDAADQLRAGIVAIPGLSLLGRPDATIIAFSSSPRGGVNPPRSIFGHDIYAIADRLEARGWSVDRQHRPASIHLTVTANHAPIVEQYLRDLRLSVEDVRANPALAKTGSAPMYGMAAKLPVRRLVARNVRALIAELYR